MRLPKNPTKLEVYSETRHSRVFVGTLTFNQAISTYTFEYDKHYLDSRTAIPLGPELPLRKRVHQSKKSELFPSLLDRIPSRNNPAFEEYCRSQNIDPEEKNPIVLLATIGKRGPSTFVFEAVYADSNIRDAVVSFRKIEDLSVRELATAFDINYPTLNRIETGKSEDKATKTLLELYFTFPDAAVWIIRKNERKLHHSVAQKLLTYFEKRQTEEIFDPVFPQFSRSRSADQKKGK
jgi:HipA-like protein